MASPRAIVAQIIKPLLPRTWKIVTSDRAVDVHKTVTVQIKQRSIMRTPQAPNGAHDIEFVLTVTSPSQDLDRAEDQLDDGVNRLVHALDTAGIKWTNAQKVTNDDRLAYDITLTLTSTKENN